ncbi:Crossover junction endonuclease mus81 [Dionaea muscipula]
MEEPTTRVQCSENEALAEYMKKKIQEMGQNPKGLNDNREMALHKAYSNLCCTKETIKTLKDFSQIKGVGKWIVGLMQGFFHNNVCTNEHGDLPEKGKRTCRNRRYVPQKNSVAYALLITLYRGTANGSEFMRKQELIDAAEASGFSRVPIAPEKGKGKPGHFGSSSREWYSGWSCMKTLIAKGLVVKSSSPAKYMLTDEGRQAANECLLRSNMVDNVGKSGNEGGFSTLDRQDTMDPLCSGADSVQEVRPLSVALNRKSCLSNIPPECLERFSRLGYTTEEIHCAFAEVSDCSAELEISSLWPRVLCYLREHQVYNSSDSMVTLRRGSCGRSASRTSIDGQVEDSYGWTTETGSSFLGTFELADCQAVQRSSCSFPSKVHILRLPPLKHWEKFKDTYEVILILDDREHFVSHGSKSRKIIDEICKQFQIKIEVRRLPIGDGVWLARHKQVDSEYILDFVVERKKVDDLRCSIRDNRYRDQKFKLLRSGLKKLIYVVEGDPNTSEAAESIKTACFTTEILEGFDVLRTSSLGDTLRKYGYLTQAIKHYYEFQSAPDECQKTHLCPPYDEFIRRCGDLEKMTAGDVFATQLMQVPEVTEDIAVAVLDLYPTLVSLAHAYSLLDGDALAQEEMLRKQNCNVISAAASKNIFQLVWGT